MLKILELDKFLTNLNILSLTLLICVVLFTPDVIISDAKPATSMLGLYENDTCKGEGICKIDTNCPSVVTWIKNKQSPPLCGFSGRQPIVCCPPSDEDYKTKDRLSEKMCVKYTNFVCPNWEDTILGGTKVQPKELPFMVHIGYGRSLREATWQCGGSLISSKWVLSAAHCTENHDREPARWARLGDVNRYDPNNVTEGEDIGIVQRVNHNDYKNKRVYFDIALYKLASEVYFTANIKPICLSQLTRFGQSVPVFAAGWGQIENEGPSSLHLLKVDLEIFDLGRCSQMFDNNPEAPTGLVNEMICAGNREGGKDACFGDSGGPLYLPLEKGLTSECTLHKQVGITSFGPRTCGFSPTIYTHVAHYLDWIEKIVWADETDV